MLAYLFVQDVFVSKYTIDLSYLIRRGIEWCITHHIIEIIVLDYFRKETRLNDLLKNETKSRPKVCIGYYYIQVG